MNHLYTNAMLDLETLSTRPDAVIAEIGVVLFDITSGHIGPSWTAAVNLDSAVRMGGHIEPQTILWWMQQAEAPRMRIARGGGLPIKIVLEELAKWLNENTVEPEIWSNGANFDGVILRQAYERTDIECPWAWWNERCYRTVAKLHPELTIQRTGTAHVALDDAIDQARHLITILNPAGQQARGNHAQ